MRPLVKTTSSIHTVIRTDLENSPLFRILTFRFCIPELQKLRNALLFHANHKSQAKPTSMSSSFHVRRVRSFNQPLLTYTLQNSKPLSGLKTYFFTYVFFSHTNYAPHTFIIHFSHPGHPYKFCCYDVVSLFLPQTLSFRSCLTVGATTFSDEHICISELTLLILHC